MGFLGVSIIVSHLNSARTITKCICSLLNQDYPVELTKIIVVDGGSTDGSIELVKRFNAPNLTLLEAPGSSEAEGQMIGVLNSTSEIIMFTNSDVYVPRDWIRRHVAWIQQGYDLVGGKVLWGGDEFTFSWNMFPPKYPQFIQMPGIGLGFSNCSTTKTMLQKVGGLKNLASHQDTEFSFRVVRHGGRMILDPIIEVYHDHPFGSLMGSMKRAYGYGKNHVIVMRAVYGRIVIGSGYPAMIRIGIPVAEEIVLATKSYFLYRAKGEQHGIRIGLWRFIFLALISKGMGGMIGALAGTVGRDVSMASITNLHTQRFSQ